MSNKKKILDNKAEIVNICIDKRTSLDMDHSELAKTVGCSRQVIWRFENGDSWPGIELLFKIFNALGLKITLTEKNGDVISPTKEREPKIHSLD